MFLKKELLSALDILEDKIRTYQNPEVDFVLLSKFLYDNQNAAFKVLCQNENFFGRYGWSKQYGHFHKLITTLEKYDYVVSLDISGWDRNLPTLEDWYNLRNKWLLIRGCSQVDINTFIEKEEKFLKSIEEWRDHVTENTVSSLIVDEEGLVVEMPAKGNRSGQNSTTIDNTGSHIIIKFYLLIKLFFKKHGREPTYEECISNFPNLMGDDNLTGIISSFVIKGEMLDFIISIYQEFGLEVKRSALKEQYLERGDYLDDFEFLGCTVAWNSQFRKYYPVPRLDKFYTMIIFSPSVDTLDLYSQRIIGLAYLTYGNTFLGSICTDIAKLLLSSYYPMLSFDSVSQLSSLVLDYNSLANLQFGLE